MIEPVNTSQVLTAALKEAPQAAAAVSAAAPQSGGGDGDSDDFQTTRIVIDNLQNAVILEYRSAKTGEVVSQYPSQGQIAAFKRAEQSEIPKISEQSAAPAQSDGAPAPQAQTGAPAPAPVPTTVAAPAQGAAPAPQASTGAAPAAPTGGETSGSGSSVVV